MEDLYTLACFNSGMAMRSEVSDTSRNYELLDRGLRLPTLVKLDKRVVYGRSIALIALEHS